MFLRKITASFLVILFVVLALPNFLIYGLSRTYLNTDFYRRDDVVQGVYEFTLDKTVEVLQEGSPFFQGYFTGPELKTKIADVFSKAIFSQTLADFANQIDQYKKDQYKPMVVSLRVLRENLLTVGNNLAYIIYQKLPTCSEDSFVLAGSEVPECVPQGVPYEQVVRPLTDNFENTVYNEIPEELSNIDKAVPLKVLINVESYRNMTFIVLVLILAMIALVLYSKISTTLAYIASSFFLAGGVGYVFATAITSTIGSLQGEVGDPQLKEFIVFLLGFLISEIQKLSIIFVIVGIALFVIRFVLKHTVDQKTLREQSFGS